MMCSDQCRLCDGDLSGGWFGLWSFTDLFMAVYLYFIRYPCKVVLSGGPPYA